MSQGRKKQLQAERAKLTKTLKVKQAQLAEIQDALETTNHILDVWKPSGEGVAEEVPRCLTEGK